MEEKEAAFLADLASMARNYEAEARKLAERRNKVVADCEARAKAAEARFRDGMVGVNGRYRKRVVHAARVRMTQAEAEGASTDGIEAASRAMDGFVGGVRHDGIDFNTTIAAARIQQAARKREELAVMEKGERRRGSRKAQDGQEGGEPRRASNHGKR